MAWCIGAGLLSDDQFHLVQARDETQEERSAGPSRLAFTDEHLVSIFSSPVFSKLNGKFSEARAWFLLLSLLTGARTDELARAPAKLVKLDDIYCLDLRDSGKKTAAAPRLVPLHPELIRLGIMVWAERQDRKGYTLVQPEDEQLEAKDWSKQLNRYIDKNVTDDPTVALYSLRHNFRQALRASGMSEELANKFFGHTDKSVGAGYGRNLSVDEARVFVNS